MSEYDVQAIRVKLETYARTKVASILHPLTEVMLIEQPIDPIAFMIKSAFVSYVVARIIHQSSDTRATERSRYLISNRNDLRSSVGDEILKVLVSA